MSRAKTRPFFLIDDNTPNNVAVTKLVFGAMRRDGFSKLAMTGLSLGDDLHYPNFKAEWLEQQAPPISRQGRCRAGDREI